MAGRGGSIDGTDAAPDPEPLRLRLHATPQAAVELRETLREWLDAAGATEQRAVLRVPELPRRGGPRRREGPPRLPARAALDDAAARGPSAAEPQAEHAASDALRPGADDRRPGPGRREVRLGEEAPPRNGDGRRPEAHAPEGLIELTAQRRNTAGPSMTLSSSEFSRPRGALH